MSGSEAIGKFFENVYKAYILLNILSLPLLRLKADLYFDASATQKRLERREANYIW